mmetsp:Transcript_16083/g.29149  ORF Transcript_16083/g.29149 Transcript_16083/m.29149 type:complete len:223 (-) Transcript_16083:258-926(-)|eukprot:CAMPEP_0201869546 /NCGR_PEP_ID=MMETSP0902-20130614/3022_1 /ASSEMBLY_ACC=CAM_ASM_000551 /TAXON_ID=420261 /ORGANISM="Thalassiosira antarctica, Strain CCMP982" /LENGTH=222 /DNA_ID=CAMNT_0048395069 /DNA_START=37 /DNA_END=705 /DNA_ORIENTATION=+
MIRSRSIPAVLSRATGDGIHAILLIDADGELLGSYGNPPPIHDENNGGTTTTTTTAHNEKNHWPLDAASIGALISEVAGDYRRMGEELLLLDPQYDSQRQLNGSGADGRKEGGGGEGGLRQQQEGSSGGVDREGEMGVDRGSSALQQAEVGDKNGKDKVNLDSGTNLKSLVIELDCGVVGVASAGPDFYIIALADSAVQHGALTGRLRSLGSHVREALSQLD